jgi:TPR repeat protein
VYCVIIVLQVRWLEAAAAQNHPDGLYNMAVMHAYGHGGAPQNNELARHYFERAAALDFAPAKNGLAMLLSNSGGEKELEEAFKLFNESSALGNSDGHYNKGILLRQGMGVAKDLVAARAALQAAADLGHPSACVLLAEMLVAGEGGPDDHIGALLLLKLISGACRVARHWPSQLPHLLPPKDALFISIFSAEMGKTGAALNNGIKSFVDNNVTEAIRLLTPLAAVGYEVAQLNLAYIYKVPAAHKFRLLPSLVITILIFRKSLVDRILRFLRFDWLLGRVAPKLS